VIRTLFRAPNANAYAERVIETIRAECLDWTLILGRRQLDQTLRIYAGHYNRQRPHSAITLATRLDVARVLVPVSPRDVRRGTYSAGSSTSTTGSPRDWNRSFWPPRRFRVLCA
jgi:Integrase core domain